MFEACCVAFVLLEGFGAVSGAVLGGSWTLLGAVLGRPGRQLGAKLEPKRAPEVYKNDFENVSLFPQPPEHYFFDLFIDFRYQHGGMLAPKMARDP